MPRKGIASPSILPRRPSQHPVAQSSTSPSIHSRKIACCAALTRSAGRCNILVRSTPSRLAGARRRPGWSLP